VLTRLRAVLTRTQANLRPVVIMALTRLRSVLKRALTGLRAVLTSLRTVLEKALTRLKAVLTKTLYLVAGRRIGESFCGVRSTRNFDKQWYMVYQRVSNTAALDSGIYTQPPNGLLVLPRIVPEIQRSVRGDPAPPPNVELYHHSPIRFHIFVL
jgi:hypothetical protein